MSKIYTCLDDSRLSWKAKGIASFLNTIQPANIQIICKASKDGKDAVRSALKELIDYDYVITEERKTESGRFAGVFYYFT